MKPKRPLTKEDRDLWGAVTRGIAPYHASAVAPVKHCAAGLSSDHAIAPRPLARAKPQPTTTKPPAMLAGDPKLDKRAARGRIAIDATLDLHGYNQAAAHLALFQFLARAKAHHQRCVLVITGKGATSTGSGILRRRFLEWIDERDFRDYISRVATAHQRHGGAGAFYIFLKSADAKRFSR